jgi:hypothetical protein
MLRLKGVYRQSWYRNQLLFHRTAGILRVLRDSGVDTLALKGIPLSLIYYADNAVRPMSDADVLVRLADLERSIRLLQEHGWRPHRPLPSCPPPHRGSWVFIDRDEHEFDLHWHVFGDCLSGDSDDDLWDAAQPLLVGDVPTKALAPADELLHALVHGIHWSPVPSIRWVPDAAAIIAVAGEELDWERLLAQASKRRFLPIVTVGLRYLHDVLAVPVPPAVLASLSARPLRVVERVELWSRMEGTALSGACRTWFGYLRSLDEPGGWPGPAGYLRYLRALWVADGYWDLLSMARSKVSHRRARRLEASAASHAPR